MKSENLQDLQDELKDEEKTAEVQDQDELVLNICSFVSNKEWQE